MKKNTQIGAAIIIIAIAGAGIGIGAFVFITQTQSQLPPEDVAFTIWGYGTTGNFTLTMSELKSSNYLQFDNLLYLRSSDRNGSFSGVSIRDILEKENILADRAINYTFNNVDHDFDSAVMAGYYLNITKIMLADYDEAILAYAGDDFDSEDGPIRAIVNNTLDHVGTDTGKFWSKNCVEMKIYRPEITVWGSGTNGNLTLTMEQMLSSNYVQCDNLLYVRGTKSYTLSGVSIRSIFETHSSVLKTELENYTFISSAGDNAAVDAGYYLNITYIMAADYDEAIFAYGGDDFDAEEDGPIRSVINGTLAEYGLNGFGNYWMKQCIEMEMIENL